MRLKMGTALFVDGRIRKYSSRDIKLMITGVRFLDGPSKVGFLWESFSRGLSSTKGVGGSCLLESYSDAI